MFTVWAIAQIVLEARRSRLLWLTHGSRADIFRLCERRALGYSALLTGALAIVVAFVAGVPSTRFAERVSSVGLPDALWAIAAGGVTLCAAAYFALMRVRAWSVSDVVLGCLIVAAAITPTVIVEGAATSGPLLAGLLAAAILTATTCRVVAKRRWERIDWTRLRSSTRWWMRLSPRAHDGR
jgi:peptidoglycan/LPS O-acetylase OafA/YrhL